MKVDELIRSHFEELGEAPDAVSRFRSLILELAIHGKLVPQYPEEESASVLLKRIDFDRGESNRRAHAFPELSSLNLPEGWSLVPAARITLIETGKRMTGGAQRSGVISLGGEHLRPDGSINYSIPRFVTEEFYESMKAGRVNQGDTLMVKDGATTGKTSFVDCLPDDGKAAINEHVFIFRAYGETHPSFLYFMIRGQADAFIRPQSQGVIGGIRREVAENLPIPLAPLAEQERIVAKVDELMALCDELEAAQQEREARRDRLVTATLHRLSNGVFGEDGASEDGAEFKETARFYINHLPEMTIRVQDVESLKQAVRDLAVQGLLVQPSMKDESAARIPERVSAERERRIEAGLMKRPAAIKTADLEGRKEFPIPPHWLTCQIDDIAIKVTDGEHITPERAKTGRFLLSARNVTDHGIDLSDVDYVPEDEYRRIRGRCDPDEGDILISCSGSVGRVAVVDSDDRYVMVRSAALVKLDRNLIDSKFVALALRSSAVQAQITSASKSTAQANLFIGPIRRLQVPLPPLAEQHRIVAKVGDLLALADSLRMEITAKNSLREVLLEAVLRDAFEKVT